MNGAAALELAGLVAHHARYRPDAPAVVVDGQRLDWRAFGDRVARVANMLRSVGVRRGDRVATCTGNSLALLETGYVVSTIRAICGETHRAAYPAMAALTVVVPTLGLILCLALFALGL